MHEDTITIIIGAAIFATILLSASFARWRHELRGRRLAILDLLENYFQGRLPADRLGERIREIAGRYCMRDTVLYPLVITAFQHTVDEKLAAPAHSHEEETRLLGLLAALKKELGLPDRYRIEAWRAGRE